MTPANLIPLPAVSRELAALTGGPTRPYARIYRGVLNAEIPAIQNEAGRYFVERDALPALAGVLGLTVRDRFIA